MKNLLFLIAALAATVVGQAQVVPVTRGGTGATTASGARTNLGVLGATDQAVDVDPAGTSIAAALADKANAADIGTAAAADTGGNGSQVSGEVPTVLDYRLAGWPTAENRSVAALTASITLTNDNTSTLGKRFQYLTPDASTWDVELPASGDAFYFENLSGSNTFDITVAATPVATVAANGSGSALWNGSEWKVTVSYETNQNTRTTDTVTFATGTFSTSLTIPQSNDPDIDAVGKLSWDANGNWLRSYDGTNQVSIGRKQEQIDITVVDPNGLADAVRDAVFVWSNQSGMSFVVTGWAGFALTDNTTINIEVTTGTGASNATVDAVELATDGTGIFYGSDTTITAPTIATGSILWLDFDDTDTPTQVHMTIYGYYDANVD